MELRNPLTRYQLNALRPLPLIVDFDWSEVPAASLLIGTVPAGHLVRETVVEIQQPFDGSLGITVGDAVAQGRFQVASDSIPERVGVYQVNNNFEYATPTDVLVYFPAGLPTTGQARIVVYLD